MSMKIEFGSFRGPVVSGFPRDSEFCGAYFEPPYYEGRIEKDPKAYILGKDSHGLKVYVGWGKNITTYDAYQKHNTVEFDSFRIERKSKEEAVLKDKRLVVMDKPSVFFRIYKQLGEVNIDRDKALVSNWSKDVPLLSVDRNPETGEIYVVVTELAGRLCFRHIDPCSTRCASPEEKPVLYIQRGLDMERFREGENLYGENYNQIGTEFNLHYSDEEKRIDTSINIFNDDTEKDKIEETTDKRRMVRTRESVTVYGEPAYEKKTTELERYRNIVFL